MRDRRILFISTFIFLLGFTNQIIAQDKNVFSTNGQSFEHTKRTSLLKDHGPQNGCQNDPFRTIDGTCNNTRAERNDWGATDISLYRTMLPEYGDDDHYNDMSGHDRPSARAVSNALSSEDQGKPSENGLSSFVFTWGQFLDHDISLTPEGHTEYEPIVMPTDEPLFTSDIPFFRSEIYEDSGITDYRQQTNLISSYIDGSNVYGSDQDRADWLRSFNNGKLKTSTGNLLPYNTIDGQYDSDIDPNAPSMAGDNGGTVKTFVAGDIRAAEQPGLSSLHTLFVRLHNSTTDQLRQQGVSGDEELYQRARKEVGAIIQSITYNEFLPALGVRLRRPRGYNSDVQADISNIFATAAYRLGHTMVTDELLLRNDQCEEVGNGVISLLEGFFNPSVVASNNIAPILNGLSVQVQNEVDPQIIDNLRNFLFGDPSAGPVFGLDLASLNIQRGRDHGLPDYNTVREQYTGRAARNFRDITRNRDITDALAATYENVNNIDLWIGLLSEDKERGSSLGPTLVAIMAAQFEKLRDGDRYFYMHDRFLDRRDRDRIDRIRLSDVIKNNTNIENIQQNVFIARTCQNTLTEEETDTRNADNFTTDNTLSIYPNPAIDFINIEFEEMELRSSIIHIVDGQGKKLLSKDIGETHSLELNIEDYNSGVYYLRFEGLDGPIIKKFVKINP